MISWRSAHAGAWFFAALALALPGRVDGADAKRLFESHGVLPLTLRAPLKTLLDQAEGRTGVEGTLELARGVRLPINLETYGKSRRRICDFLPLKMTVESRSAKDTAFEGISTVRAVTHCKRALDFERSMLYEYLVYRSYSLLAEPALRVRLARITYVNTDRKDREDTAYAFLVEDVGLAANRHGLTWSELEKLKFSNLDPAHTTFLVLFQYLIGNIDWSALRGPEGERCCHNVAVLTSEDHESFRLLPFDFDQSGLVNAPYAAPAIHLGQNHVTQRVYRGFCAHNDQLPAAIEIFNQRRGELEALFTEESLPQAKGRKTAVKFIATFYRDINDPVRLGKKIMARCR